MYVRPNLVVCGTGVWATGIALAANLQGWPVIALTTQPSSWEQGGFNPVIPLNEACRDNPIVPTLDWARARGNTNIEGVLSVFAGDFEDGLTIAETGSISVLNCDFLPGEQSFSVSTFTRSWIIVDTRASGDITLPYCPRYALWNISKLAGQAVISWLNQLMIMEGAYTVEVDPVLPEHSVSLGPYFIRRISNLRAVDQSCSYPKPNYTSLVPVPLRKSGKRCHLSIDARRLSNV